MSKHDSSSDKDDSKALAGDEEAAQNAGAESESAKADAAGTETDTEKSPTTESAVEKEPEPEQSTSIETESGDAVESKSSSENEEPVPVEEPPAQPAVKSEAETTSREAAVEKAPPKPGRPWFGLFNFLLILVLAAGGAYYWWQQQQVARDNAAVIADLKQQLANKADHARLDEGLQGLSPLRSDIEGLDKRIDELGFEQKELRASSEKLYELFGRDKSDWQLAEVEYLMRVAQHKLILQDDFEGAAITLQAASDKIGQTGDPGLLPVRVMISDEIADLKTRKRPDLVGATLVLAQMGRQVRALKPGFPIRIDETPPETDAEVPAATVEEEPVEYVGVQNLPDWFDRFIAFIDSLVEVRSESREPSETEANVIDIGETLEDNLKLARWAVLDRDAHQYQLLIVQTLRLFREYYDLDNAANHEFLTQLQDLQKMELRPEKPDITGSLYELKRILSQRENAPEEMNEPVTTETTEPEDG